MSTISNYGNIAGSTNNYNNTSVDNQKKKANETENTGKMSNSSKTDKNGKITGKTIGQPKLSEKAAKYYEQLKKKYSNMDFILVSEDQKENAKAQAGSYANASKTVVLIDEDKIERMVEDENYRKQYEGIIGNAASGLSQLESAKAEKKAEEKKAKKKEQEERLKKKKQDDDSDDTITITASSIEELIKKIEDYTQNEEVNNVQTKEEKAVGQHIDFKG